MQKSEKLWIDVKELRLNRGWLQEEAAEKLGISRAHLSAIENEKRGISTNMIAAIIRVFDLKLDNFIIKKNY